MITGVRSTGNIVQVKRVIDIARKISVLEPDSAPLTQLTKKLEKRVAINPEYKWLEEEALSKVDQVNYSTGYTSGATSVVVDNGAYFRAGDVVKHIDSGEQALVTDVSTNTLTVRRGWGSTSAATWDNNDYLLIVGNANTEHATKRTFKTGTETTRTNYTQIFRTPFGASRTNLKSEMYGGKDLAHVRMMQLIEHQKEIERGFWFGEPKEDTVNDTYPRRATGGVDYWLSTNATDAGGTLTETEFEAWLRTGFRYGSNTKYLFAAPILVSAISTWARGKLQMLPKDKTYGIAVTQFLSPHGTVNIVNMKLFSEVTTYAGYGYLLDLDGLAYRYLTDSDTKLKTNIQANDADGEEDEYISEIGFQLEHEKKGSWLYNMTSFS
ncbi:MAG: hypothetical protein A2562_00130 [Candidatus Nealsonbacteria bacterium RIFOXYD1_FULL_39_11]|nr:MAG: hypothetical protein A2562_00130 [Candidatus Nealsonbacteria bacterium RIFOXYD1_FULL_39_11]